MKEGRKERLKSKRSTAAVRGGRTIAACDCGKGGKRTPVTSYYCSLSVDSTFVHLYSHLPVHSLKDVSRQQLGWKNALANAGVCVFPVWYVALLLPPVVYLYICAVMSCLVCLGKCHKHESSHLWLPLMAEFALWFPFSKIPHSLTKPISTPTNTTTD
jgi:hypothetical protein